MDLPHRDIRFTTTDDGVGIAYWEIGAGKPVMIIHNMSLSHAEVEWSVPSIASFYLALAKRYRVIRFDPRSMGLSMSPLTDEQRDGDDGTEVPPAGGSTADFCLDIAAVAAACRLDRFALLAASSAGPAGIEYAATRPEQITELVLGDAVAKIESSHLGPLIRAQSALGLVERASGAEIPSTLFSWIIPPDEQAQWMNLIRASGIRRRAAEQTHSWDAMHLLSQVQAPTLVLSSRNKEIDLLPDARRIVAGIPDAQLRIVDGQMAPYTADREAVLGAIDELLTPTGVRSAEVPPGFRTVAFTDVVESTAFIAEVGDDEGRVAIRQLEEEVAAIATGHGGIVVKNLGDGSLISFSSNTSALKFACAVQEQTQDSPLLVRIGMAAGEPLEEDGDIHGAVVVQASRVADLGDAGEIVVADSVRQLALGKGFSFEAAGDVQLKGFQEPTAVWKVRP
jgi:class 3 adenylate cyclase